MLDLIKNFLWNYMFVPLFLIAGAVCIVMIIKNKGAYRGKSNKKSGEVSPVQTLFVTLASTIGTGNIIGVALAIGAGGPGAVFWMWVAAFFGMAVSYCENALGIRYRSKNNRPVPYMPKILSRAFAFLCILTSIGIGNMTQSNSAANALYTEFGVEKWVTGIIFSILALVIIKGGLKGITRFTDVFVPVMSLFYIISALLVIYINFHAVIGVFESIFKEAFSIRAITGGALATGVARGVMSGEAGVGSTVILSSRSNAKNPHTQGLIGAVAIFIDTIVICTLTALSILLTNSQTTQSAFYSALGKVGGGLLDISVTAFAFTTIIGWSYFGIECTGYLFGEKKKEIYKVIYSAAAFIGAVVKLEIVWGIGDVACALMAVPNLLCVIFLARNIKTSMHPKG